MRSGRPAAVRRRGGVSAVRTELPPPQPRSLLQRTRTSRTPWGSGSGRPAASTSSTRPNDWLLGRRRRATASLHLPPCSYGSHGVVNNCYASVTMCSACATVCNCSHVADQTVFIKTCCTTTSTLPPHTTSSNSPASGEAAAAFSFGYNHRWPTDKHAIPAPLQGECVR